MISTRVIPCLLLSDSILVKTRQFKDPKYVGDPINAIRIFNDKEVDELIVLDISASRAGRAPDVALIHELATECFMPLAYGGGVTSADQLRPLLRSGVEKVVVNTAALSDLKLIEEGAAHFGSQAIVGAIDAKRGRRGAWRVFNPTRRKAEKLDPVAHAQALEQAGVGEIFLNSVDRDGTQDGYELDLITAVSEAVDVPVIASGGAGTLRHFSEAVAAGASAVAAGAMFVFHGRHRAVLINYPSQLELEEVLPA